MGTRLNVRAALLFPEKHTTSSTSRHAKAPTAFDHHAIKRRICRAGMVVLAVAPLPDGTGMKYTLLGGAVVLVYFNGNHQVQGKVADDDRMLLRKALRSR
jgi:hypothetical protein